MPHFSTSELNDNLAFVINFYLHSNLYAKNFCIIGRVGRNPPSVLGSIRLCGLPGLPVGVISLYLPFLPAVWPFQRNRGHTRRGPPPHGHPPSDVSFLLQEQGSPPTPRGVAVLRGGWSFLRSKGPVSCPPTRPTYFVLIGNKCFIWITLVF